MRVVNSFFSALVLIAASACSACNGKPEPPPTRPIPEYKPVTTPPVLVRQQNEVEISDLLGGVDPTLVLGSLVNTKTGQVLNIDNYLTAGAKPTLNLDGEVVYRHLIENSVAANASYLDFVSASLSDSVRAEVSIVKSARATVKGDELDRARLLADLKQRPPEQRNDLGLVIGYVDFVLSASLFKQQENEGTFSGYGAKIGGKWFNKDENSAARHRVVAIWAPLHFVVGELAKPRTTEGDLTDAATRALKEGQLKDLQKLPSLRLGEYMNRIKRQ